MTMKLNIYLVSDETEMRIEISPGVLAPKYPRLLKVLLLSSLFLAVAHCRGIIQMQAGSRPLQVLAKHLRGTASPHSCWK